MKLILIVFSLLMMHSSSFSQKVNDSTRRLAAKGDVLVQKNVIYTKAEIDKAPAKQNGRPRSTMVTVTKKKHKKHIRKRKVSLMK